MKSHYAYFSILVLIILLVIFFEIKPVAGYFITNTPISFDLNAGALAKYQAQANNGDGASAYRLYLYYAFTLNDSAESEK